MISKKKNLLPPQPWKGERRGASEDPYFSYVSVCRGVRAAGLGGEGEGEGEEMTVNIHTLPFAD